MPKPFNRRQTLQNRAWLDALAATGNTRLAAEHTGLSRSTLYLRRRAHPAFARQWSAAVAVAHARFHDAGGRVAPVAAAGAAFRTKGGEIVVTRGAGGKLKVRRSPAGHLTRACEQAFLTALSATANVKLSAAAAGAPHMAFYRRKHHSKAFAREWRLALQQAYRNLESELLAAGLAGSHEHDDWRHNDPPPIPPMTANQALQLMYLHQKEALMLDEPPHIKRRRGESHQAHSIRLSAMHEARLQRDREAFDIAEADRRRRGQRTREDWLFAALPMPDLAQVTGWSKADPAKTPHDADRALFGGWRLEDLAKRTK